MESRKTLRLRRNQNAIAWVFLGIVIGTAVCGTAFAAIGSSGIVSNAIRTRHIKNGQVKTVDLRNRAVTAAKLASGSVSSSKIASGAVTNAKLGDDSVKGVNIQDGAVTGAKLGVPIGAVASDLGFSASIANSSLVTFDILTADFDPLGAVDLAANTLTVPVDGVYQVCGQVGWNSSAAGTREMQIQKNAAFLLVAESMPMSVGGTYQSVCAHKLLIGGDVLSMVVYQSSGGALLAGDMQLSIMRVGTSS